MSELQNQLNELKEEQEAFIEVCQIPCKDCKLNVIKEILRKTLKKLADVGISGFIDEELLAKLDVDKLDKAIEQFNDPSQWKGFKTEKKEDSEALKGIKKIAQEESEFYNKHGYFSFWSDALKIKRITEMKEKKDSRESKKEEWILERYKCFGKYDDSNPECIEYCSKEIMNLCKLKDSGEICEKHPQKKKCVFINTEHCKICGYWNKGDFGGDISVPKSEEAICKTDMELMDRKASTDSKHPECKGCDYDFDEDCSEGCCKCKTEENEGN